MINIVLYEPEIPENTGNIMRTCAGTNSCLHLIEPLGFVMDEKRIKRSGVNYIDKVNYQRYIDYDDFKEHNDGEYFYFTRYGTKPYSEIDFMSRFFIRLDYFFPEADDKPLKEKFIALAGSAFNKFLLCLDKYYFPLG